MKEKYLTHLLQSENEQLQKLNHIVLRSLEEEKLLSGKLAEFEDSHLTAGERLSDKVALFGGSWLFIISFLVLMGSWIAFNVSAKKAQFDPYPFILLNLILSTVAALQAPLIMMSQNRREKKDRKRAENDYMVNLKAEVEIRNMHEKLDLLIADQMKTLFEIQKEQISLMEKIGDSLDRSRETEISGKNIII
ncbi:MAG: DUF1003 domain-containing protein [Chitinophagaceae bacterium]|nr:MAG: DUF1003 domain-containing protein [Chitinophagaceae bacterium]